MDSKTKARLKEYIINGQTDLAITLLNSIDTRPERTSAQNRSLHLWFNLIEREAENQGVTWDMLIKHTTQLRVTSEGLKSACKQLIKALWGYTSTIQLKKTGDLDKVIDHMTDWLSKEMEVPPFPCDEEKQNLSGQRIGAINNLSESNYPEWTGESKL
jgi:hypothetical protein